VTRLPLLLERLLLRPLAGGWRRRLAEEVQRDIGGDSDSFFGRVRVRPVLVWTGWSAMGRGSWCGAGVISLGGEERRNLRPTRRGLALANRSLPSLAASSSLGVEGWDLDGRVESRARSRGLKLFVESLGDSLGDIGFRILGT